MSDAANDAKERYIQALKETAKAFGLLATSTHAASEAFADLNKRHAAYIINGDGFSDGAVKKNQESNE